MSILVCYDDLNVKVKELQEGEQALNLRITDVENQELLEIYESSEPDKIAILRDKINEINPDEIIVIGRSEGYRWLGTLVCRIYGQFNSWLGQYENRMGVTTLKINNKEVTVKAYDTIEDWRNKI